MSEQPQEKKENGKKILLIIFILILAGINGFQYYMHLENEKEHASQITQKNEQIDGLVAKADSLIADLNQRKEELAKLGADTANLGAQIRELIVERDKYKKGYQGGWNKAARLQKEIDAKIVILKQRDDEIARLTAANAQLDSNVKVLQVEKTELNTQVTSLTDERDGLKKKVDIASVLRAENMSVTMLNAKGKEYEKQPFKGKKIDKLKIAFNLGKNDVAEVGTKPIAIRIVEPGGAALYDLATGGGSFTSNGKEMFYSAKQDIMFSNKNEKVNFMYAKGAEFKTGDHTVEIYEGESLIGKANFSVK